MDSVLILIAAPGSRAIDAEVLRKLRECGCGEPKWLAAGEAAEFLLSTQPSSRRKPGPNSPPKEHLTIDKSESWVPAFAGMTELKIELRHLPIDIAILPAANRRKRLLIADMDSTMICQECIDELGEIAGLGDRIREITARAMRGELDFEGALIERVALMKGLASSVIDNVIRERITYMPGGKMLIATMKANGAHTALVSGGFVQFTSHVATALGFDEHRANDLVVENELLAGLVRTPILGKDAKVESLHRLSRQLDISAEDAIAVGDGANDIPMLQAAGLGVALHAKPKTKEAAKVAIDHADLTALLYLQGYNRAQFID